jgi:cephalosporin hydroxylase
MSNQGDKQEPFRRERMESQNRLATEQSLRRLGLQFLVESARLKYSYNFDWLGRPIIQYPEDLVAMQEIIWRVQPDVVVETGVAHGGSLIHHASLLAMLDGDREVVGIDIDIRPHNRKAITEHPLHGHIRLIEGSSIAPETMEQVYSAVKGRSAPLVVLDSSHTHEHVLNELRLYSPLVRKGGYVIVLDTVVEDMPEDFFPDRPWGKGNNPKTAVHAFLKESDRFEIDREMDAKLLITTAPNGYLRCIKD